MVGSIHNKYSDTPIPGIRYGESRTPLFLGSIPSGPRMVTPPTTCCSNDGLLWSASEEEELCRHRGLYNGSQLIPSLASPQQEYFIQNNPVTTLPIHHLLQSYQNGIDHYHRCRSRVPLTSYPQLQQDRDSTKIRYL